MKGLRAKDAAIKAKIGSAPARSTHNAYANYLQYKRMNKADPSGALKARIKSGMRHERKNRLSNLTGFGSGDPKKD